MENENVPLQIIVHHSAAEEPVPQFDAINEWHKARGFPISTLGFYVGYHYVIEKDGTVRQARADNEEGAHAKGQNFESIGVCLVGDFDTGWPTEAQIVALGALINTKVAAFTLPPEAVFPHRHWCPTSCYGTRLPDDWALKAAEYVRIKESANVDELTLAGLLTRLGPPAAAPAAAASTEATPPTTP